MIKGVLKEYITLMDYESGHFVGIDSDGMPYTTDDILKAKTFPNIAEVTIYNSIYPTRNWKPTQVKIKVTRKIKSSTP